MLKTDEVDLRRITIHENLIEASCAYIRVVTKANNTYDLDEHSVGVFGLLTCLENLFYCETKDSVKWLKDIKVWRWVAQSCLNIPQNCVLLVGSLDNLKTGLSKLRAFLRLALQSKRLHVYLEALFSSLESIKSVYQPTSVLLNNEVWRIVSAANELASLDFCFDVRADDLNSPHVGKVDYAYLLRLKSSSTSPLSSAIRDRCLPLKNGCKRCQDYVYRALSAESKNKYLTDVIRSLNTQVESYKSDLVRMSHQDQRLQTAFDQLQTKFVLLNEEYNRRLQLLAAKGTGADDQTTLIPMTQKSTHGRPAADWSAVEATEDLDLLRLTIQTPPHFPTPSLRLPAPSISSNLFQYWNLLETTTPRRPEAMPSPRSSASEGELSAAVEATEDLDVVDFLHGDALNGSSSRPQHQLPVVCPQLEQPNARIVMAEQETSECTEVYRLPGPGGDVENVDSSNTDQLSVVVVKPLNTNYRARFSVPWVPTNFGLRRPRRPVDLLSELQQTDSSFRLTGVSIDCCNGYDVGSAKANGEDCCSTSDQISEFGNEADSVDYAGRGGDVTSSRGGFCGGDEEEGGGGALWGSATATNSSRNTVLESTSTIRAVNSCNSLTSPASPCEIKAATDPPIGSVGALRHSASELLGKRMVVSSMGPDDCWDSNRGIFSGSRTPHRTCR